VGCKVIGFLLAKGYMRLVLSELCGM